MKTRGKLPPPVRRRKSFWIAAISALPSMTTRRIRESPIQQPDSCNTRSARWQNEHCIELAKTTTGAEASTASTNAPASLALPPPLCLVSGEERDGTSSGSSPVRSPKSIVLSGARSVFPALSSSTSAYSSASSVSVPMSSPTSLRRPSTTSRKVTCARSPQCLSKSASENSGRAGPGVITVIAGRPGMAPHSASRSAADASVSALAITPPSQSIQHLKAEGVGPRGGRESTTPTNSIPRSLAAAASAGRAT
mmetsp:Transcript_75069/g.125117  ORF Transcript_75069/g.125117 Transcript_75069/m.125117 type:complete len:252 (+) Transcript_75069:329-1084(+)